LIWVNADWPQLVSRASVFDEILTILRERLRSRRWLRLLLCAALILTWHPHSAGAFALPSGAMALAAPADPALDHPVEHSSAAKTHAGCAGSDTCTSFLPVSEDRLPTLTPAGKSARRAAPLLLPHFSSGVFHPPRNIAG
jgi:hypothetical protein